MRRSFIQASMVAVTTATTMTSRRAGAQTEVRFARGTSSAMLAGSIVRGERAAYSLGARAGQRMSLRITSDEDNAVFQLYAPGARLTPEGVSGTALPGAGEGEDARRWEGTLPKDGSYLIVVGATRGNASYRLDVTIS